MRLLCGSRASYYCYSTDKNCVLYPRPFDVTEGIFAVLYVSVMDLTRFYKTTVFLHLYYVGCVVQR